MKHSHPPHHLLLVAAFSILTMGSLVLYYTQKKPGSPLTPTQPVSKEHSIGGTQHSMTAPTPKSDPSSSATTNTKPPTAPTAEAPVTKPTDHVAVNPDTDTTPQPSARSVAVEYPYRALGTTTNDPYYSLSLASMKTGAMRAWDTSTGNDVVVAVIDTGYSLAHEDLTQSWYQNSGETGMTQPGDRCWKGSPEDKRSNGCDDDNNGYTDDWRGWNFYGTFDQATGQWIQNNTPQAGALNQTGLALSHGTQVAGLIGATSNNEVGIASPNWRTKVMPLQALNDDGEGVTSDIINAIYYAVDNGAKIINMSLGGSANDPALLTATTYAYNHGVTIIAAAGNCGTGQEQGCDTTKPGAMGYPALYDHVIGVGATDANDARASFSSYGPGLDVVAPGSGKLISPMIDTSVAPHNYTSAYAGTLYGTSFASPVVAGIASLILSVRPSALPDDITAIIDGSARKVGAMNSNYYSNEYGHGVITADTGVIISKALAASQTAPQLRQTGNYISEHSYSSTSTMSSACVLPANTYCTVRLRSSQSGFDRYLPYSLTSTNGDAGWSWPGASLDSGEWRATAVSGDKASTSYYLFSK